MLNRDLRDDRFLNEIAKHFRAISDLLGIEPTESNVDTPLRLAKMYANELFLHEQEDTTGLSKEMTMFKWHPINGVITPVEVKNISFNSMCEHHWLPFSGMVDISYYPNGKILGLSKFPRVVKWFSLMPQIQENLTQCIGWFLVKTLDPLKLSVRVEATHACVACRGAESDCETSTYFYFEMPENGGGEKTCQPKNILSIQ